MVESLLISSFRKGFSFVLDDYRFFYHFNQSPPFVFGQWTSFHDFHDITNFSYILFIMCLEFLRGLDAFVIQIVLFIGFNSNYDGFISTLRALRSSLIVSLLPDYGLRIRGHLTDPKYSLMDNGFSTSYFLAHVTNPSRVIQLASCQLKTEIEKFLFESSDLLFNLGSG
jgi:hypothetical protein